MSDVIDSSHGAADEKNFGSAAETLIEASFEAQTSLVASDAAEVIPAMAESPIPVLAARNRTPDPLGEATGPEVAMA